jgi:hypothetical protein
MTSTNIITTEPERLGRVALQDLAGAINREHAAAAAAAETAVGHALNAGRLLLQVKAHLAHGEFLPWLRASCAVKQRQARQYMRLAKGWATLETKTAPGADLTIKGALRLLDDRPSETPTPKTGEAQVGINGAFGLPDDLQPDVTLTNAADETLLEITPCRQAGYFHVAAYRDLDTDNAEVVYTRRGIASHAAGVALQLFGIQPEALTGGWHPRPFDGQRPWYVKADDTSAPGRFRQDLYHGGQRR